MCHQLPLRQHVASRRLVILLPKLRMHFAEFLNEGFPAHLRILSPPTCVGFGTGACSLVRSFSRQCSALSFGSPEGSPPCQFSALHGGFASLAAYRLRRALPVARLSSSLRHSILMRSHAVQESSPVVHRLRLLPRLRSRLTLRRRALLRKPWAFGGTDSHRPFRYLYRHSHFRPVHMSFRSCFVPAGTLPYPCLRMPRLRFCA